MGLFLEYRCSDQLAQLFRYLGFVLVVASLAQLFLERGIQAALLVIWHLL